MKICGTKGILPSPLAAPPVYREHSAPAEEEVEVVEVVEEVEE